MCNITISNRWGAFTPVRSRHPGVERQKSTFPGIKGEGFIYDIYHEAGSVL